MNTQNSQKRRSSRLAQKELEAREEQSQHLTDGRLSRAVTRNNDMRMGLDTSDVESISTTPIASQEVVQVPLVSKSDKVRYRVEYLSCHRDVFHAI